MNDSNSPSGDPLRLLTLYSYRYWTGGAEPSLTLARDMQAIGHQVLVGVDHKRDGNIRSRATDLGLQLVQDLVCSTHATPLEIWRDVRRLRSLTRERQIQILHSNLSHDHLLGVLSRQRDTLLVRSIHSRRSLRRRPFQGWLFRRTDGLTVAVDAHRRSLIDNFGLLPERIALIHGAVDPQRFQPDRAATEFRNKYDLPLESPLVGMIARFSPDRRHRELIEAFGEVRRAVPGCILMLAGRGERKHQLQQLAERLHGPGVVRFPGYLSGTDLAEAYAASDLLVWLVPGNDSSCRGMLEAMATRRPVVVGNSGAMLEAVQAAGCGEVVEAADSAAIAAAVIKLLQDPQRRQACGQAGRDLIMRRHTPEARRAEMERFYRHLLELGR